MSKFFKSQDGCILNLDHVVAVVRTGTGGVNIYTVNPNAPVELDKQDAESFLAAIAERL